MANVFFISDLHLGHERLIQAPSLRPFSSIEEHDEAIIDAWNSVVKPKDIVWVLGDISIKEEPLKAFDRMIGRKRLILGNHDKLKMSVYCKYFEDVSAFEKRYHNLVMTHIPVHPQEMSNRTWEVNVHGHIHHPHKDIMDKRYLNVNADIIGMVPISLEELRSKL